MATELGKAYVQILPSAKGIKGAITKELNGESASAGKVAGEAVGGNLISTLKKLIVAAGIGKVITDSLNLGGELQQNLGGSEAVFGEYANNLQNIAADAYKNMGLSQSDYLAAANKMGSLLQGSGIDQAKAMDLTTNAMQRAADVASVMGIDTVAAMEAIAGAAKGNFTMMDNLGVAMNATTLKAYALEKGINFDWNTASNAEKNELALKMFMDRTTQYAGNFARESEETFSGSIGAMRSAWTNLLANLSLGNDISQSFNSLVTSALNFLTNNLLPMVGSIIGQIPNLITNVLMVGVPQVIEAFKSLFTSVVNNAPQYLSNFESLFTQIFTLIKTKAPEFIKQGGDMVIEMANGLLQKLPTLITDLGTLLNNALSAIMQRYPEFASKGMDFVSKLARGVLNNLPAILSAIGRVIGNLLRTIASNAPQMLQKGWELIGKLASGIIRAIPQVLSAIGGMIVEMGKKFSPDTFLQAGRDMILGLARGIDGAVSSAVSAAVDAAKNILGSVKGFFGIASPSKVMANQVGKWIPAGIAEGIKNNMRPLDSAMNDLVSDTVLEANNGLNSALNSSNVNVEANSGNSALGAKLDTMIYLMQQYYPDMAKGADVDGNALVSAINKGLGVMAL